VEPGSPLGIIQSEQREALLNPPYPREFWQLSGHHSTHAAQMVDCLYSCRDGPKLRLKPRIQIHGTQAIDSGGIFDDKISQTFVFLLESDIFEHDPTTGLSIFSRYDDSGYSARFKYYYVLGQILYWFVLVREIIPYPSSMSPAIIAYGIYGSIPQQVLHRISGDNAVITRNIIEEYTTLGSVEEIDGSVQDWLLPMETLSLNHFVSDLRDPQRGAAYLSNIFSIAAVGMEGCLQALEQFKLGFTSNLGFDSVLHLMNETHILETA
jgi:hypothetical protein